MISAIERLKRAPVGFSKRPELSRQLATQNPDWVSSTFLRQDPRLETRWLITPLFSRDVKAPKQPVLRVAHAKHPALPLVQGSEIVTYVFLTRLGCSRSNCNIRRAARRREVASRYLASGTRKQYSATERFTVRENVSSTPHSTSIPPSISARHEQPVGTRVPRMRHPIRLHLCASRDRLADSWSVDRMWALCCARPEGSILEWGCDSFE